MAIIFSANIRESGLDSRLLKLNEHNESGSISIVGESIVIDIESFIYSSSQASLYAFVCRQLSFWMLMRHVFAQCSYCILQIPLKSTLQNATTSRIQSNSVSVGGAALCLNQNSECQKVSLGYCYMTANGTSSRTVLVFQLFQSNVQQRHVYQSA